jgi:hypothetical protein
VVVARTLRAEIVAQRRHWPSARIDIDAALETLRAYPMPLIAWKSPALRRRIHEALGDRATAGTAFAEAAGIVAGIARHIDDEALRRRFEDYADSVIPA